MVFGAFDGLHPGHLDFFKQARKYGDELVVVIARNINVFRMKGKYPQNDEKKRLVAVKATGLVDVAELGHREDPYQIIREENPDVICLGYDQQSFSKNLAKKFPDIEIVRLKAYKPEIYKSSKLKK